MKLRASTFQEESNDWGEISIDIAGETYISDVDKEIAREIVKRINEYDENQDLIIKLANEGNAVLVQRNKLIAQNRDFAEKLFIFR